MECVGKILEIDFKKSDPNSDAKPNFFPNSDGKLFFSLITTFNKVRIIDKIYHIKHHYYRKK